MTGNSPISQNNRILVTGSNGFIGASVVDVLLEYGFEHIRCFVRPSSNLERLKKVIDKHSAARRIEIVTGDLTSADDCKRAAKDIHVTYHLAAGFDKSFAAAFMNSAISTRNLLDALLDVGKPVRFVNVSSFAVYSNINIARGGVLDEDSPIETSFQERYDPYGFGKWKQEEIVRAYGHQHGLKYVILRPGTVFGPGKKDLTGRIGIDTFGFFIHIGGSNLLPLTYVTNCAEAIVMAGIVPDVDGQVFNVVDDEPLTSAQFLKAYKQKVGWFFSMRLPYWFAYALCVAWESYSRWSNGQLPPAFNRRRCAAEWRGNRFPNNKLRERLVWQPRVTMKDAMSQFLAQFNTEGE
jgi:nucleoside-diphosphate-sugar epimerase